MSLSRTLLTAASVLALAACATAPVHVTPPPPAAAAGAFLSTASPGIIAGAPVEGTWWRLYQDPVLDALVADALAANTDIRVAVARLARARASLREVRSQRAPRIGLGGGVQYGRSLEGAVPAGADRDGLSLSAGLDVAYEADLFGRLSSGVEAARGNFQAAEADAAAARVLVVAETVRAYADAASAAERREVAERVVALLDRSLNLTRKRHSVGLANGLEVARIAALRHQRQADVPALVAERQAALFRLATLTGRAPQALSPDAGNRRATLRLDRPIPVGDGAGLLVRRPDVAAAERRLAAATARIGVATADLYPRITLGGSVGSTGSSLGNLLSGGPMNWLLGPLLNWTVNRAPARARIAAAEAESQEALANFDGTVLRALQETETALSAYGQVLLQREALGSARREAERAVLITRAQQREGQIASLELLDAERTFADAEAELARADAAIANAQVDLFRALGGGWNKEFIAVPAA